MPPSWGSRQVVKAGIAAEFVEAGGELGFEGGNPAEGVVGVGVADEDVGVEAAEAGH